MICMIWKKEMFDKDILGHFVIGILIGMVIALYIT